MRSERIGRLLLAAAASVFAVSAAPSSAHGYKALYSFCADQTCARGANGLIRDASGNLYGTTYSGGNNLQGTVFELSPGTSGYTLTILYSFCAEANCADGSLPYAPLVMDVSGNLYGTTNTGGGRNDGEVFELVPSQSGWSLNVLYSFCATTGCPDGKAPLAGLGYQGQQQGQLYDGSSPLFGTTTGGGAGKRGVAFELQPNSGTWSYQAIYSFCPSVKCTDASPSALLEDASGNLYGTTYAAGAKNDGSVFELSPSNGSWTETDLYSFCSEANCADGYEPSGGLAMDQAGNLYGVTQGGGGTGCTPYRGCGVLYKVVPDGTSSTETVLYSFCPNNTCVHGEGPGGTPVLDSSGNIYGAAVAGGTGQGTLFRLSGSKFSVLHTFCVCADGGFPVNGVIMGANGDLYGTTTQGGANSAGVVYRYRPK